jgi:hypothetical protein
MVFSEIVFCCKQKLVIFVSVVQRIGYNATNVGMGVRFSPEAPCKNALVYRHREVVKDNDKQQPVCFYMVKRSTGCKRSPGGQVHVAKGVRFPDADAI